MLGGPGLWITVTLWGLLRVRGQKGNGCGHTRLGPESGTLASPNYTGTYPQDVGCRWRLQVPAGRTLRLLFGDFDIEWSEGCGNGSLVITPGNGTPSIGPLCGRLTALESNLSLSSRDATVVFRAGRHRSGRGFLLSYATDLNPDLISCQTRGSHFSSSQFSVYCPAGCKNVTGKVWGNSEQGYRDTSVLCESAVHGGVVSDSLGGPVTVTLGRSLKLYESTFDNGILSKTGSLSEHKLLFSNECNGILAVSLRNASSSSGVGRAGGRGKSPSVRGVEPETWTADAADQKPWVQLELADKSKVTGIVTNGSENFYIRSFMLKFSKDGKSWKLYKAAQSKEGKVFEAHADGYLRVMNSLFPPVVARFIQLHPLTWQNRPSAQVQVLGCPAPRVTSRTTSASDVPTVHVNTNTTATTARPRTVTVLNVTVVTVLNPHVPAVHVNTNTTATTARPRTVPTVTVLVKDTNVPAVHVNTNTTATTARPRMKDTSPSDGSLVVGLAVVLGLLTCGCCLLAGLWWKRRKKETQTKKPSMAHGPVGCQSHHGKRLGNESERSISYPLETLNTRHHPLERDVRDTPATPPLNDYAEPGGQTLGSTFRPDQPDWNMTAYGLCHYRTPGSLPEYAQPLPPEPEYATPFSEPLPEGRDPGQHGKHGLPPPPPPPPGCGGSSPDHAHYDCPSHRVLSNGYCTPSHQGPQRPASAVYSEAQCSDPFLQERHTYEELL